MEYIIKNIDHQTGQVIVVFSIDNKEQNISGLPIDYPQGLAEALSAYGHAYAEGLEKEKAQKASKEILKMIGKTQTVIAKESLPQPETNDEVNKEVIE